MVSTLSLREAGRDELTEAGLEVLWQLVGIADASLVAAGVDVTLVQFRALTAVARHAPLPSTALARIVGVAPSTATRMCDRLAGMGLLIRGRSSSDRRVVTLSLTPRGARVVRRVTDRRRKLLAERFDAVPGTRRRALAAALEECAATLAATAVAEGVG